MPTARDGSCEAAEMNSPDPVFAPEIRGTFYRAIDSRFYPYAVAGSRTAGRYSRADKPTLYLSSSVEGVDAALIAHRDARASALEIVEVNVEAAGVVDLRDRPLSRSSASTSPTRWRTGSTSLQPVGRRRHGRCATVSSRSARTV